MCGRYGIDETVKNWILKQPQEEPLNWKVADIHPTEVAPVMVWRHTGPLMVPMRWGMERQNDHKLITNARVETLWERPMFAGCLRARRCILPASHFYEWDMARQKVTFRNEENDILVLAGIYSQYEGMNRFVIITQEADDVMRPVHHRMPVRIPRALINEWLGNENRIHEILNEAWVPLRKEQDVEQLSLWQ